jgi:hypothetical protein
MSAAVGPSLIEAITAAWNDMSRRVGNPTIRLMTPARRATLLARIAEVGVDGMLEAIAAIGRSPHCTGCNDRGWRADFDFLLQPSSLIRTLEGRYEGRQSVAAPVYRNGALALLMADARTGETPEQAQARQMAEIDARAAGALIDHVPDDCGLFELPTGGEPLVRPPLIGNGLAAEAAHSAQRSAGPERRSNRSRAIGDVLGGL